MDKLPALARRCLAATAPNQAAEAWYDLARELEKVLRPYVRRFFARPEDVKDALQTILIRLADKIWSLRDLNLIRAWAFQTAKRVCLNLKRTMKEDPSPLDEIEAAFQVALQYSSLPLSPAQIAAKNDEWRELRAAIERLSPRSRRLMGVIKSG